MQVQRETADRAPARPAAIRTGILVIGGGASGVMLAAHLLSDHPQTPHVTLVERRPHLGRGLAYATEDPAHLLNSRVGRMSARPGRPDDFRAWLEAETGDACDPMAFVQRATYGRYLGQLLDPWRDRADRLACVHDDCTRLDLPDHGPITAHLAGGQTITADRVVLATGHSVPDGSGDGLLSPPWDRPPDGPVEGHVLIIGTGLTMVDQVLTLLAAGHADGITALSRRGLLPRVHRPNRRDRLDDADLPLGAGPAAIARFMRGKAEAFMARGGDWREVVDGLRPFIRNFWQAMPERGRGSFVRHGAAWWDVHRFRMPPQSREALDLAIAEGRLTLRRGAFVGARRTASGGLVARYSLSRGAPPEEMSVGRIIDCRGVRRDPERHATPLIAHLLASGAARIDPFRIGLDIAPDCGLIDRSGAVSDRLFAIGPASRAAFWEVTAVPDIRDQIATLAPRLLAPEMA